METTIWGLGLRAIVPLRFQDLGFKVEVLWSKLELTLLAVIGGSYADCKMAQRISG